MRFAVIPSEARYDFPSHVFCAMNPSSVRMTRKERFLTSQSPFGMTNSEFFSKLPNEDMLAAHLTSMRGNATFAQRMGVCKTASS